MGVKLPIAATLAAVMAVSSLGINTASAAPAVALPAAHQSAGEDGQVIQVASKKRHRGNNAAAAAAFAGIAGAMIGLAAQESQRDRYYDRGGGYYGGNQYYGGRHYSRSQPHYYRGGAGINPHGAAGTPGPQVYGPGEHPAIQNWGLDR